MRVYLYALLLLSCLATCKPGSDLGIVPPAFLGKAASELPFRLKAYSYPAYRKGVIYKATATHQYDAQNRLLRIDSIDTHYTITYRYADNRLTERLYRKDTALVYNESFTYNQAGQLAKKVQCYAASATEYTYLYNTDGQLIEQTSNALTYSSFNRIVYTWKGGNMTYLTNFDANGKRLSEWSFQFDQQPNYKALPVVNPNPDVPLSRNNQVSSQLEKDYIGLIDLCVNPFAITYRYLPTGLPIKWTTNGCSTDYNELVFEPKQ